LGLLLLSVFHLAVDVPGYGLYALRDSTFSFEALFLLLGILYVLGHMSSADPETYPTTRHGNAPVITVC